MYNSLRSFIFFNAFLLLFACQSASYSVNKSNSDTSQYYQNEAITLDFFHDTYTETSQSNPFLDYRLQVDFVHAQNTFSVPGFFAADGNSEESSTNEGNVWRVKFTPPFPGEYTYQVSFTKGRNVAVIDDPRIGDSVTAHHGQTGVLYVQPTRNSATGFVKSGRLQYVNQHYLQTQNGESILLIGANSPENFLAYADFDGTYSYNPDKQFLKTWQPHVSDWRDGDTIWQKTKGKGMVGALNYLASKEMNVVFALVNNIEGDAQDVWPFISHKKQDYTRYDVSKLAQWDLVFGHAEKLGIAMMLGFQEQENQLILDDGNSGIERRLFIREMIARFGYRNNIYWNIGEEHGGQHEYWPQGQNEQQRFATIRYLKDNDPYKNPITMGTYPNEKEREEILKGLLRFDRFDGISMQSGKMEYVHDDILRWRKDSAAYNRPWVITQDELGPWHTGTKPDVEDPEHNEVRKNVLWGALMAGAGGVQWYFGWLTPPHDLNAEDWRSRNNMWEQSAIAQRLFKQIDYAQMSPNDALAANDNTYVLAKADNTYLVYAKNGGDVTLDLSDATGVFDVLWFDPRKGNEFHIADVKQVTAGDWVKVGEPPYSKDDDWAVLFTKDKVNKHNVIKNKATNLDTTE